MENDLPSEIVRVFSQRRLPTNPSVLSDKHSDFGAVEDFLNAMSVELTPARINTFPISLWAVLSPRGYAYFFYHFMVLSVRYTTEMKGNEYIAEFEFGLSGTQNNDGFERLKACFKEFTPLELAVTEKWVDWFESSDLLQFVGSDYLQTQQKRLVEKNLRSFLKS